MSSILRVGLVQMRSGLEPEANVAEASRLIRRAVADGAEFVATPEMTNVIEPRRSVLWEKVWDEAADLGRGAGNGGARIRIGLSAGSLALRSGDPVNRSLLYAPDGRIVAL